MDQAFSDWKRPVNLERLAEGKYKLGTDEASETKYIGYADRWDLVIKCFNGEIYPFSDRLLAFHCIKKIIRNRLHKEYGEVAVRNWSDNGEAIFLFELNQFELIAKYAKPKKRRILSPVHRLVLTSAGTEALKRYRESHSKASYLRDIGEMTNKGILSDKYIDWAEF